MSEGAGAGAVRHDAGGMPHHHRVAIAFFVLALLGPVLGVLFGKPADLYQRMASGWFSVPMAVFGVCALILPLRNPKDFFGGALLVGLGLFAMWASSDLPGMRGFAFGPGTAPRLFAFTLAVLAIGVVIGGLLTSGPDVSAYKFRGVIFIIGSILAFAATIRPLGLVIASFATMIICAAAAEDVKWRESIVVAAVITAFCAVLFPYGLNLPFQLWPRFW